MMYSNEMEKDYVMDMAECPADYKISIYEFKVWTYESGKFARFMKDLDRSDIFVVAYDYCIPVIMIKYFRKFFKDFPVYI